VWWCAFCHSVHIKRSRLMLHLEPLSNCYSREVKMWLRNNPGRVVTLKCRSPRFSGLVYAEAANIKTSSLFTKIGIYLTDRNVSWARDFLASETTERPITPPPSQPGTLACWSPNCRIYLPTNIQTDWRFKWKRTRYIHLMQLQKT